MKRRAAQALGSLPARLIMAWCLLVGGAVAGLASVQHDARQRAEDQMAQRAAVGAGFTAAYVRDLLDVERRTAESELAAEVLGAEAFRRVLRRADFPAALLLDDRGRVLQVEPATPQLIGIDLSARYAHLAAAVGGRQAVSNVVPSAARGIPVVAFATPYVTPHGRRVLSGAHDLRRSTLGRYLESAVLQRGGRVLLVDANGVVVAASKGLMLGEPLRDLLPGLAAALRSEASVDRYAGRIVAHHAIQGTPWRIVVDAPVAAADPGATGAEHWLPWAILALLAVAGAGGGVLLVSRIGTRERLAAERRFLATVLDSLDTGIVACDADGRLTLFNRATQAFHGLPAERVAPGEWAGHYDLFEPDGVTPMRNERIPLVRALAGGEVRDAHLVIATPGQPRRDLLCNGSAMFDEQGRPLGAVVAMHDVTARLRAERAVREAEERFRSAFEEAHIGMALVAVDGAFLRVNDALCAMLHRTDDDLLSLDLAAVTFPQDIAGDQGLLAETLAGDRAGYEHETRLLTPDGSIVHVLLTASLVRDPDDVPLHFITQVVDVTERHEATQRLAHLADHDPLTNLVNRRRFDAELERQVAMTQRYGAPAALLLIDLDGFKVVNDALGHAAGDRLLERVAAALRGRLRETDVVGRLGGDEFGVLLPETDARRAREVAEALLDAVRRDGSIVGVEGGLQVTASVGVATIAQAEGADGAELMVRADLAMYEAKAQGRGRVVVRGQGGRHETLGWVERLTEALAHDRFELYAQPVLDLATGRLDRSELLLRLHGDDGEVLLPGGFLPAAERFGLMGQIDAWVARRAIALVAAVADRTFAVNVSAASVCDPGFATLVADEIARTGAEPGRLVFELTETAAVTHLEAATAFAERLRGLGCGFSLDDFGTGFASFSHLKHLPFTEIKLDGSFVAGLAASPRDKILVRGMTRIAIDLGVQTVAEWVDDEQTVALLRSYGVDYAQGFSIGRPAPLPTTQHRRTISGAPTGR